MKLAVVIPTYNEKENIARLMEKIFALGVPNLEIIVVDDNSPDGTSAIVQNFSKKYPVHLLSRPTKQGIGSAYIAGFKKALAVSADVILQMDADSSHDPGDIPRLLKEIEHADCVIGSRKIEGGRIVGWSAWRKFMSAGAMRFARLILRLKTRDVTAGFRCFHREVLQAIGLDEIKSNGYAFQEEMLYRVERAGFTIKEIPVIFVDRQKGKSKLSKKDILEFFWLMIKLKYLL